MSTALALLLSSTLNIFGKLVTQVFFEKLVSKLIIYGLEKLAPMTTNQLDNEIVKDIKFLLTKGVENESEKSN